MKNIFFTLLLFVQSTLFGATLIEEKGVVPVKTPAVAAQEIRKIRLSNNLEAYLVSDPQAPKSGAAIAVQAGSWQDPQEHPGIAHFLEHMLFLGTKKYPNESEYQRYINENGGMSNAFTSNDSTHYLFTVDNDALIDALDRFSQFFKEPLFNPSGVARELNAIDQEYAKNLDNDDFRELFVIKQLSFPDHPDHTFLMGNSKTLSNVSQETLKQWYADHYSANLMRLIVYSNLPIDTLENQIIEKFSDVKDKEYKRFKPKSAQAIDPAYFGHYVYIEPVKEKRQVTLLWELPKAFAEMPETKPIEVISHILGHEGSGSLLNQLKDENLATELRTGGGKMGPDLPRFYLQVELTEKGMKQVNLVILRSFQALARLREEGVPTYLFDEMQKMAKINYQYRSRDEEFTSLMKNTLWITDEDIETFPEKTLLYTRFDPKVTEELLTLLTPQRVIVDILAPKKQVGVSFDRKEQWMGVPYAVKAIPPQTLIEWSHPQVHPNITLPVANPFIPEDLALLNDEPKKLEGGRLPQPEMIFNGIGGKAYFAPDSFYLMPKVIGYFHIKTPEINEGESQKVVLADLLVKSWEDAVNTYSYPASIAGMEYKIDRHEDGVRIKVGGFSDKADLLLKEILKRGKELEVSLEQFKIYKDALTRGYQDFSKEGSYKQTFELFKSVLYKQYTTEKEKVAAVKKINYKQFLDFKNNVFSKIFLEAMVYGNVTKDDAKEMVNLVISTFDAAPYPVADHTKKEVVKLPEKGGPLLFEAQTTAQGNALLLGIEGSSYSFQERAAQQVMMQAVQEPFFHTLRTEQQTGYIVFSLGEEVEKNLFNLFGVQSNSHGPLELLGRFELFLEKFVRDLKGDVPEERFEVIKTALKNTQEKPPKSVAEMGELLNKLAFDYDGNFQWIENRVKGFEELDYTNFIAMTENFLGRSNKRRLAVLVNGNVTREKVLEYHKTNNLKELKSRVSY